MKKVLIIRFSSLGDVVLTGPVLTALRKAWPDAMLCIAVKRAFADVLQANPAVDQVFALEPGEPLFSFVKRIRAEHFDVVIDLHANLRSRVVSFFSGARERVRYRKAALARRLFVGWRWSSSELQKHTLDRYLAAVRPLGITAQASETHSIVVIQTAFLGDAVLTRPLLDALHARFPQSRLSVVCTPEIEEVFRNHPAQPELIIFDKHGREKSWAARFRFAQALRQRHFDLAVIPHRSLTSAWMAWWADISRRVGFSRSQGRWLMTDVVPFRWGQHDVDRNLVLMSVLGGQPSETVLSMQPEPSALADVQRRLREAGVSEQTPLLGINAGSVWATKRWLPEGFAAVADRAARELGLMPVFIGGKKDQPIVEAIVSQMHEKAMNWAGSTSLKELIALISRCRVFLTNDSGPMHIAVACQIPTVAIFGPTTRELGFFPYGSGHRVVEKDLSCRPCGLHGHERCPLGHFQCMRTITADEVFEAVRSQSKGEKAAVSV